MENALNNTEELKILSLAILSFCIRNNKSFVGIIQEASGYAIPESVIREAIGEMGNDLYTILLILGKPGRMATRLSKLLGNNLPADIPQPKLSKELVERLKSDSFLFM